MLAPARVGGADINTDADGLASDENPVGRIDVPPDRSAIAELPEDFGRRFLIFVDTEEEFDWSRPLRRENVPVEAMEGLPEAHRFFREAGAKPAYMVDYPIVDNDRSAAIIADMHARDGCEIGTQLHPWVNPPHDEVVTPHNSFTGNLPLALQRAKLERLTERIAERVGQRPVIYRAGRYGIGARSAELLENAGYAIDSSVRALFDYSGEGGPDFSGFGIEPFWAGPRGSLLEMPLTATFIGPMRRNGGWLYRLGDVIPKWRSLLGRTHMLQRVSLTPEDYPLDLALEAIRRLIEDGQQVFSLSYHSPSVVPGYTPYVRDGADLAAFYRWWDGVFELFARHGVESARVADIVTAARAAR